MTSRSAIEALAESVRVALEGSDLEEFAELLDPNVTWGAPDDPAPTCQSRKQVLGWYHRGKNAGRRTQVLDVTTHGDKILISMTVTSTPGETPGERWQVLTVADGRIMDIRGYDDEARARGAVGAAVIDDDG